MCSAIYMFYNGFDAKSADVTHAKILLTIIKTNQFIE